MSPILNIKKRDGRIVPFESSKISNAIWKAAQSVGGTDTDGAEKITEQVTTVLDVLFKDPQNPPSVEQIQDLVEKILIEGGHAKTAKAYILYRAERSRERTYQENLFGKSGEKEMLNFSPAALKLLQDEILQRDQYNHFTETPSDMVTRVVEAITKKTPEPTPNLKENFRKIIEHLEFIPSIAILANAGTSNSQLSEDFAFSIEDSIEEIFSTLKKAAIIYKNGGAVGINFSQIRPDNDVVKSKPGLSSGPVSFIELFNTATKVIKKGLPKFPLNMAQINIDHPNILEFLSLADNEEIRSQCKLAVSINDQFITALENQTNYELKNPRDNSIYGSISAHQVFDNILANIWKYNSPQLIFTDQIGNNKTITPSGQLLINNETCHCGAINITKFINTEQEIDWDKLKESVHLAIEFLDSTIDSHNFTCPEIETTTKKSRKIELNTIGILQLLQTLKLDPTESEAKKMVDTIGKFIQKTAEEKSNQLLAKQKTNPTNINELSNPNLKNTTLTTFKIDQKLEILANLEPIDRDVFSPLDQLSLHTSLQDNLDGSIIPEIQISERGLISEIEKICLEAYHRGCQGISIVRKHAPKIEEVPITAFTGRDHSQLSKVQEIIPPPMIEMSRVVKETLRFEHNKP